MQTTKNHPGIYVPPPLVYVAMFFLSVLIQRFWPLDKDFFYTNAATLMGIFFILAGLFFNIPALRQFAKTKNTLITIKPASSLQTTGIYSFTRNPMYLSLLLIYTGIALLAGNWWTLLSVPLLAVLITRFIIRNEEKYLERAFGQTYLDYKLKVRRWI